MSDFVPDHIKAKQHAENRKTRMKITTNHKPRQLLAHYEIPLSVLMSEFDYILEDGKITDNIDWSARFFKYRDSWYDVNEFTSITESGVGFTIKRTPELAYWDGVQTESHSSGVLARLAEDETVIVGWFYTS